MMFVWLTANCNPVLVQRNVNGSRVFDRSWAEFKVGFNDTLGNYWLGNDLLSYLTLSRPYKLRVEIQARNFSWYYAEYSSFNVSGESSNYTLHMSGYSGDGGDGFGYHNGMMFTTYDRDNDKWSSNNCASYDGAGFWYKSCASCHVNGYFGCWCRLDQHAGGYVPDVLNHFAGCADNFDAKKLPDD